MDRAFFLEPALRPPYAKPPTWVWSYMINQDKAVLRCGSMRNHPKPLANIIVQPGLNEPIEKYFETHRMLSDFGCNVYALSWRGQGGSDPYLSDRFRRHSLGFDHDANDLKQYIDTHVPPDAPRHILAHSMGAMITTLALARHPDLVKAAFLISPFFGFHERTGRFFEKHMAHKNFNKRILESYIPMGGPWRPRAASKSKKPPELYSSDPVRMHLQDWWLINNPELQIGSPTIGFVRAASNALTSLRQPGVLENMKVPALIFSAGNERVVRNADIFNSAVRWKNAFHHHFHGAKHEILMERDRDRLSLMQTIENYLKTQPAGP